MTSRPATRSRRLLAGMVAGLLASVLVACGGGGGGGGSNPPPPSEKAPFTAGVVGF